MKAFRLFLFLLFILPLAGKLSAQDTIYKADRSTVIAKITEVGTYDIKYKRYAALDGPLYILHKTDVWKIAYADGTVEYFNRRNEPASSIAMGGTQRPFCLSLNIFDIPISMATLSAEFNLGNSNAAIRIPLSFGLRSGQSTGTNIDGYYYNSNKVFSSGVDLLYFPTGKIRQSNYYIGFATEFGTSKRYRYNQNNTMTSYMENYGGMGIMNGVQIQVAKEITIGIDCTIGMQFANSNYRPMGRLGLLMGWRFGKLEKNATLQIN